MSTVATSDVSVLDDCGHAVLDGLAQQLANSFEFLTLGN